MIPNFLFNFSVNFQNLFLTGSFSQVIDTIKIVLD